MSYDQLAESVNLLATTNAQLVAAVNTSQETIAGITVKLDDAVEDSADALAAATQAQQEVAQAIALSANITGRLADPAEGARLVGYQLNAIGSVARLLQGRLGDEVWVTDFGAVGDGVTDNYAAFQKALTWASTVNKGRAHGVTIRFPAGEFRTSQVAVYDIPAGTANTGAVGINLIGAGPAETLIVATSDNTTGCFRLTSGRNIEAFAVSDMAFLSDLPEDSPYNNGVALTIDSALKRGDASYGDQPRWSVLVNNLWIAGYGKTHSDVARRGNWQKGIYIADKYHPKLQNIRCLARYSGTLGTRTASSHAVHLHACYSPDLDHFYIQGSWEYGVWLTDLYNATGGWEDFRLTNSFIAASDYGFGVLHENDLAGSDQLTEPGGVISNLHLNARKNGITIKNHHQVLISGVYAYVPRADRRGTEMLPCCILLDNASDIIISGSQFLEPGFYNSDTDASVAVRIESASECISITAQFGHGGIGVVNNSTATTRKTIVINAELTTSRRIIALWAAFKLLVDNAGTATVYQNILGNAVDTREFASGKANASSYPMSIRIRSLVPGNAYGGALELSGSSLDGALSHFCILRSRLITSTQGAEDTGLSVFIKKAGVTSEAFRLQAPAADNDSYGYLMFQVSAAPVIKRIKLGATNTGPGSSGRALYVDN